MTTLDADMIDARRAAVTESRILREACEPAATPTTHLTYTVTVTCPRCAGRLHHITGTPPPRNIGLEAKVVTKCEACHDTFIITIGFVSEMAVRRACNSIQRETEQAMSA